MIVFVRLCRAVLEGHWIPQLYGDDGAALAEIFAKSDAELDAVAAQALSVAQRHELTTLIDTWLDENPDQFRVEGIRFADFSEGPEAPVARLTGQARHLLKSSLAYAAALAGALMVFWWIASLVRR